MLSSFSIRGRIGEMEKRVRKTINQPSQHATSNDLKPIQLPTIVAAEKFKVYLSMGVSNYLAVHQFQIRLLIKIAKFIDIWRTPLSIQISRLRTYLNT
jgi:hypothetical protein